VQQSFEEHFRDFGVFGLDESYFGAKRGRGAAGKTPVFGLLNVLRELKKRIEVREKKLASAL
jgi:hypothetical protein